MPLVLPLTPIIGQQVTYMNNTFEWDGTEWDVITGVLPAATNTLDLGAASLRWRNIYTQDLHLSNGIGDYTIVEGEEDLFLVNNKSGKSFKFPLIEVDPNIVPEKSSNK